MKTLPLLLILSLFSLANAQSDNHERFRQENRNLTSYFQRGEYDEALKAARQVLELSLSLFGHGSYETATVYSDTGLVLSKMNQSKEAIKSLQMALGIFEKLPSKTGLELIETYQRLGNVQMLAEMDKSAAASYLKSIQIADERNGIESKESFSPTLNLANLYARGRNFTLAFEYYQKCYFLYRKHYFPNADELFEIQGSIACLVTDVVRGDKVKKFFESIEDPNDSNSKIGSDGTVNGIAISLPKPKYPSAARNKGISGKVVIRLKIDEQGNVVEAKPVCGHPLLIPDSVESAKLAKFSPTLLDNRAISVGGLIVYKYSR